MLQVTHDHNLVCHYTQYKPTINDAYSMTSKVLGVGRVMI